MRVEVIIQTHFLNFKWADKRLRLGSLDTERGGIISSHGAQRKYSSRISNILPFSGGRLFAKDTGSSRPGRSVGVSPGFIKGPCDGIFMRDDDSGQRAELPASLVCETRRCDFCRRLCSSVIYETGIQGDTVTAADVKRQKLEWKM